MLTDEDITKIIEAEKEVYPIKKEFASFRDEVKKDFSDLQDSVNGYFNKRKSELINS